MNTIPLHQDVHLDLNDEEVVAAYKVACDDLSYFNAAERPSWARESAGRGKAQRLYGSLLASLKARGLRIPQGNWLL